MHITPETIKEHVDFRKKMIDTVVHMTKVRERHRREILSEKRAFVPALFGHFDKIIKITDTAIYIQFSQNGRYGYFETQVVKIPMTWFDPEFDWEKAARERYYKKLEKRNAKRLKEQLNNETAMLQELATLIDKYGTDQFDGVARDDDGRVDVAYLDSYISVVGTSTFTTIPVGTNAEEKAEIRRLYNLLHDVADKHNL